jgi:phospholipid/cholesterol/gamma-HCH transport system permease protein
LIDFSGSAVLKPLETVGNATLGVLSDTGELWSLAVSTGRRLVAGPWRSRARTQATLEQSIRAGIGSLPLVGLLVALIGMIMALQGAYQLDQLGALQYVPALVGVSVTRELAPLIVAIVVAARVGSAIAAELGTMQVSEEIDALKVMGLDPVAFLVVPRVLGLLVGLPCLTIFADVLGMAGGLVVGVGVLGLGGGNYVRLTLDALVLQDIVTGLVKAAAFAAIVGFVSCHQGLATRGGAEEVGRATTQSVVRSIVLIIATDLFVTALFFARG